MHVAVRRIMGPKGWIEEGEEIPDAVNWPYVPLRACINLGLIRVVEEPKTLYTLPEVGSTGAVAGVKLSCPHCPGKDFKNKGGLASHMRSHR